jgi:regulator of cell morphogenesis and NO signaling
MRFASQLKKDCFEYRELMAARVMRDYVMLAQKDLPCRIRQVIDLPTLAQLIEHILSVHHVFTRTEIARIRGLLAKVCTKHSETHVELEPLRRMFDTLSSELEPHMFKEERILFPYIIGLEQALTNGRPFGSPPFGTVANPIRMMMVEHDNAGHLLKEMHELTWDYTPPADACMSYRTLYQALDELEKDLHEHIHLENNILFPRATELEASV